MELNNFLIDEEITILEAMELLDKSAKKVLFVAKEGKLIAAITDGDTRRWILKKGDLNVNVRNIANYKPKFAYERDSYKAKKLLKKYSIEALPIVDEDMHITSVVFWDDEEISNRKKLNIPVVIMAGGLGTRLYPYTKILPKPLIPIGEIPIAEHIINRFYKSGSKNFYMIVNHKRNMIKAYFNEIEKDYIINYMDEDKPLGTGGGLSLLKGKLNSTFILSNCDVLIEGDYEKIYRVHKNEKNLVTMVFLVLHLGKY